MEQQEVMVSPEHLSTFAAIVQIDQNPVLGFWLLYSLVVLCSIVVFLLGFARKLPLLKTIIVYIFLFIGCLPLTIFAIGMPVVESLLVAAIVFGVYRFRMTRHKQQNAEG